jgi:hypothetical protein
MKKFKEEKHPCQRFAFRAQDIRAFTFISAIIPNWTVCDCCSMEGGNRWVGGCTNLLPAVVRTHIKLLGRVPHSMLTIENQPSETLTELDRKYSKRELNPK